MSNRRSSPTTRVVAALVAGLTVGIAISASGNTELRAIAAAAEPIGTVWINAIRMTVTAPRSVETIAKDNWGE